METQNKNLLSKHPIIGGFLGFIAVVTVVSAFDSGSVENYNTPTPTNTLIHDYRTPAPSVYKTPQTNCHPSYSGCLRVDASDYDCIGGTGNGPYYTGRVMVNGYDEFGLDRDGDGIGCE